ncbi:hypothetical protein P3875_07210 [Myroides sp. JBRI-B21084]|uniref:hypothetical protein n=1 Tax=Myroides sp. JBRI-B21084 TaxID=3119977 RepID=UPI0026E3B250|nr:hypothetical protein [Paenimyroides cloacae]WKW45574.1 hypothetical protein P3875_07210 [Paenimyroides cloacae]
MNLQTLHQQTQEVISAIANKQPMLAKEKLLIATDLLNKLIDHATNNEQLIELTKYETLLTLLQNKLK